MFVFVFMFMLLILLLTHEHDGVAVMGWDLDACRCAVPGRWGVLVLVLVGGRAMSNHVIMISLCIPPSLSLHWVIPKRAIRARLSFHFTHRGRRFFFACLN